MAIAKKSEKGLAAKTKSVKVKPVAKLVVRKAASAPSGKIQTAEGWKRMMKKSKTKK